jgi:hypothetical protein
VITERLRCQYEAQDFKCHLKKHLDSVEEFFRKSARWMNQRQFKGVRLRILSGDFILFEFGDLGLYHPESVVKRAWAIYRSVCEHEEADWRVYRSDPGTFHTDEHMRHHRYAEVLRSLL